MDWFSGWGTEIGTAAFVLAWLAARAAKKIVRKLDAIENRDVSRLLVEHDEMYEEFYYRKKREESAQRHAARARLDTSEELGR